MVGWVEPVTLTEEQADMIRRALAARRDPVFHEVERQDKFLRHIEGALTYLRNIERSDIDAARDRLEVVQAAALRLRRACERLTKEGADAIDLALGTDNLMDTLPRDLARLTDAAGAVAATLRKPRGRYYGDAAFLLDRMAASWRIAFSKPASAAPDGAFAPVANVVFGQLGFDEAGKDMLRAVLNPAE